MKKGTIVIYTGYHEHIKSLDWAYFEKRSTGLELVVGREYTVIETTEGITRDVIAIRVTDGKVDGLYHHPVDGFKIKTPKKKKPAICFVINYLINKIKK